MNSRFAETLKKLRAERGLSQVELANMAYVTQPAVARWEKGNRLPSAEMITRLAQCLDVDVRKLLSIATEDEVPNVIMVEDREVILNGGLSVLGKVLPDASVVGFEWPAVALDYARENRVSLAFLDIELGTESGFDLCRELLAINPRTNVVYLTAYADYALDAWSTGASGFMLKPITDEAVRAQLANLRYPFPMGDKSK